jgi:hypothetical protein
MTPLCTSAYSYEEGTLPCFRWINIRPRKAIAVDPGTFLIIRSLFFLNGTIFMGNFYVENSLFHKKKEEEYDGA